MLTTRSRFAHRLAVCGTVLFGLPWICAAQGEKTAAPAPAPTTVSATSTRPADGTADPKDASGDPQTPGQAAGARPETPPPDGFRMGAFTFKPSGRVKLDLIRDFKPIGSED